MNSRSTMGPLLMTFALIFVAGAARGEVTRVEISSRQDVLGGKSFGSVGPSWQGSVYKELRARLLLRNG
jgi:hypothetical protein